MGSTGGLPLPEDSHRRAASHPPSPGGLPHRVDSRTGWTPSTRQTPVPGRTPVTRRTPQHQVDSHYQRTPIAGRPLLPRRTHTWRTPIPGRTPTPGRPPAPGGLWSPGGLPQWADSGTRADSHTGRTLVPRQTPSTGRTPIPERTLALTLHQPRSALRPLPRVPPPPPPPLVPHLPRGGKSVCEPTPDPGADAGATCRALSRRKQTHHVHDGEDEPLGRLSPVVLHHVGVGHHQGLHRVFAGQPDGIPPLPPVPRLPALPRLLLF